MKTNEIKKFVKNNKTVFIIAICVIVTIIVVVCVKKIKNAVVKKNLKADASTLTGQALTPGLHHGELLAAILEACNGLGTDEEAIYGALSQLGNQADWEYLKTAWSATFNEIPSWQVAMIRLQGISQSLTSTLSNELNKKELQRCRDILASKQIEPGF